MTQTNKYLLWFISFLVLLITACSSNPPIYEPVSPIPPPTREITSVPLILTPVLTPAPLPALPPLIDAQSSKSLAIHDSLLITVNSDSDSVTLVDTQKDVVIKEIHVGDDPRTVAIAPDGTRAFVTVRGDNTLAQINLVSHSVDIIIPVGHMPYGVVTDGKRVFVSSFGGDSIDIVDIETGQVVHSVAVSDAPAGLALSGEWLLITHFYSGQITLMNVLRTPFVIGTTNAEPDGNLARSIVISPDGLGAYIAQTRIGLALISTQYMQDWFPVITVLDTATMMGNRDARITISVVDQYAANMPFDMAFSSDGTVLYVVLAGNDKLLTINLITNTVQARYTVGSNPRGIALADDKAYVLNALDGTLTIINTQKQRIIDTISVTTIPLEAELLLGKTLFHQAGSRMMSDGAISCATCHFDGGMDGRTWINFRSGPRNTPALGDISSYPPFNWAGDMTELHDTIEDHIRNVMLGEGLIRGDFDPTIDAPDANRSDELDALVAYVESLETWPSPHKQPDGTLTESAQRGMMLFMSGSPGCVSCHMPPLYTDLRQHNIPGAAFSLEVYEHFDTPTLYGLWASAPYMHDGVAQTLEELLTRTDPLHSIANQLTEQQLHDLIAFLLSL